MLMCGLVGPWQAHRATNWTCLFLLQLEAADTLPYLWTDDVPSNRFLKSVTIRFGTGGLKLGPIPVLIGNLVC